jgi:hypothetical protein
MILIISSLASISALGYFGVSVSNAAKSPPPKRRTFVGGKTPIQGKNGKKTPKYLQISEISVK